jgi:hypothetical protein
MLFFEKKYIFWHPFFIQPAAAIINNKRLRPGAIVLDSGLLTTELGVVLTLLLTDI